MARAFDGKCLFLRGLLSPTPWPNRLCVLTLASLLASCGGIVDQEGTGGSATGRGPFDGKGTGTTADAVEAGTGASSPRCECESEELVELNGPDGIIVFGRGEQSTTSCASDFAEANEDSCNDFIISGCAASGSCIYVAKTNSGALLQLTDPTGSSIRTMTAPRENVTFEEIGGRIFGDFSFADLQGARYWGIINTCTFATQEIDDACTP